MAKAPENKIQDEQNKLKDYMDRQDKAKQRLLELKKTHV
jgi:hypothetical protein